MIRLTVPEEGVDVSTDTIPLLWNREVVVNIYEKIAINILYYMDKLQKDEEFQKQCPGITAGEYLAVKTGIKPKKLNNILTGKGKTRLDEVYKIAMVLNIKISDIITQEVKQIED